MSGALHDFEGREQRELRGTRRPPHRSTSGRILRGQASRVPGVWMTDDAYPCQRCYSPVIPRVSSCLGRSTSSVICDSILTVPVFDGLPPRAEVWRSESEECFGSAHLVIQSRTVRAEMHQCPLTRTPRGRLLGLQLGMTRSIGR